MSVLRKDPFGPAWVLILPERGLERSDFGSVEPPMGTSPYAPGNEGALPPEIQALRPSASPANGPDWRARVLPVAGTPFSARTPEEQREGPFRWMQAYGRHELVIEHRDPAMTIDGMPRDHLTDVLRLYRDRLAHLAKDPAVLHVQMTRTTGRAAGALVDHPHGQVLALPVRNRWVEEEATAAASHFEATGSCLFCDVLAEELRLRERVVSANAEFVVLAPYAAKTPFETWIVPRVHQSAYAEVAANRLPLLAELLRTLTRALNAALDYPPTNMILHTRPSGGDDHYHWHIEVLPRLTRHAGFDWASGAYVNPTPPEDAARFLRQALALNEVDP
jgi:UDPglucose--hexose-1-phosphate uridylyltransferase